MFNLVLMQNMYIIIENGLKDVLPRVEQTLAAGRSTQEPRKGRQQKVSGGCRVQSQDTTLPGSGSEHVCFSTLNNIFNCLVKKTTQQDCPLCTIE